MNLVEGTAGDVQIFHEQFGVEQRVAAETNPNVPPVEPLLVTLTLGGEAGDRGGLRTPDIGWDRAARLLRMGGWRHAAFAQVGLPAEGAVRLRVSCAITAPRYITCFASCRGVSFSTRRMMSSTLMPSASALKVGTMR
ncbi:MAG: hypothetical protein RL514_4367 [Verrucomicrobiota bacterium]